MNALLKFEQDLEWYIEQYNMMKMFKAYGFIVKIKYCYMKPTEDNKSMIPYMETTDNQIYLYDAWTGKYTWISDWWEGQEYIELLGLIDIEDVTVKTLKEIDEMEYGKDE